jgi:plastocyanin
LCRRGEQQQKTTNKNTDPKIMKTTIRLLTCAVVAAMSTQATRAALNIPSDGSDGALVITDNTVIDLSQAVTGKWNDNNSANAGKGVYDPEKWAVVFKYSSVTIQGGATVTFMNHASRAPVVWLVNGDVTINGTVNLDGQGATTPPLLAEPGPGGFRGGSGNYAPGAEDAAGFGPGGGARRFADYWGIGGGGSYGSWGEGGSSVYGNPSLIPLIGGAGGAGSKGAVGTGGGAGAGAILIGCAGSLAISGIIHANGGSGIATTSAGGSGGGIRLVTENLTGTGIVQATGGGGALRGGLGRIRVERVQNTSTLQITPDPSVIILPTSAIPQIWLPTNGPTVKIVSIGGNLTPVDPRAEFGAIGADTILPRVTSTTVVVETTNVEQASVVTVRATPRSDGNFTEAKASVTEVVSEDPLVVRWTANVPVKDGYAAIQVKVVRP